MALWRVRATVDDRPGFLSVLTASLALKAVNILAVQVHTTEAGAVDDFLVDAPDAMTETDLRAAVERGRGRDAWVAPAAAQGLADQPTRALHLAGRLVRDPDALGDSLRTLLDADSVTWRPAPGTAVPTAIARDAMVLPDPDGGRYEVCRAAPPFTPAEYARAQALVEIAAFAADRAAEHATLILPGGAEVTVRPATRDDLAAVLAMHDRCSTTAKRRRYRGATPSAERLGRQLESAVVATVGDEVVALATLTVEGRQSEATLLVEDRWQHRGLGTALARRLLAQAERTGCAVLIAHTGTDNGPVLRTLERLGRQGSIERDDGQVTVTVSIGARTKVPAPT
jgi:GNAT superfamily N-acetyltransferase